MPITVVNNNSLVSTLQQTNPITINLPSAVDMSSVALQAAVEAEEWSQEANNAADRAESNADRAESAADRAEAHAIPSPFVWAFGGQSLALGSNGATSAYWPTETGLAFVYVPSLGEMRDVTERQGLEPFNPDGSNNPGVQAAIAFAKRYGVVVHMFCSYASGTEISAWTGGGYDSGVLIDPYDRTISTSNRVQFKVWTDAVTTMGVEQFHAFHWDQGEADYRTPDAVYRPEVEYLCEQVKGIGSAPDTSRVFPCAINGLYSGINHTGQERRDRTLAQFCREHPDFAAYVDISDAVADPTGNGGSLTSWVHIDDASIVKQGRRTAAAVADVWFGKSTIRDGRIEDMMIPASGVTGQRIGYRTHELDTITASSVNLTLRGADLSFRGETRRFSGACTANLDPTASATWRDGGCGFEFYMTSASDSITFTSDDGAGATNPIWLVGSQAAVAGGTGLTITGARGRGKVIFEFNQWVIYWWPIAAPKTGIVTLAGDSGYTQGLSNGSFFDQTGTLTAARNLSLGSNYAKLGSTIRVRRSSTASFAFTVRDATVTASSHVLTDAGNWVDMVWDGSKWVPWVFG